MSHKNKEKAFLLLALQENFKQFLFSTIGIFIWINLVDSIIYQSLQLILNLIGYAGYYYAATPFVVYWLAYVSVTKLTKVKLLITILLVGVYSYVMWDSYFFFKETLAGLM